MRSIAIARLSVLETTRRKDFYVVLILVGALAVWLQFANLGASGAGRFARDIIMQVAWLASFALAAPLAARQIPQDVEQKTVYVLLARDLPRWRYVLGRAIGAAAASVVCLTGFFLVLVVMLAARNGWQVLDAALWQAYVLQVAALVMFCALTVFFSTFSTPSAAVVYSFLLLAVMRYGGTAVADAIGRMSGCLGKLVWGGYLALPHFEFFNMIQRAVHGWGALPAGMMAGILVYALLYSALLVVGGAMVFKKKWL